jgi:hypothetical protein
MIGGSDDIPLRTTHTYGDTGCYLPWVFQMARIRQEYTRYTNIPLQEDSSNERLQQSRKLRVATLCARKNAYRMGEPYQQTLGQTKKVLVSRRALMSIDWEYILQIWEDRNKAANGDTPAKAESIRRNNMIDNILHIQAMHTDLPLSISHLI